MDSWVENHIKMSFVLQKMKVGGIPNTKEERMKGYIRAGGRIVKVWGENGPLEIVDNKTENYEEQIPALVKLLGKGEEATVTKSKKK